jgi:CubicO group peptidase (beta-lactamase class C family)
MPDTYPIQRFIRDYQIGGDGPKLQSQWPTTDQWLQNLGALPLLAQPGERWMYNVSIDVLGALISRVADQPLGAFMRQRIFEPLGMKDTAFWVPPEKIDRLPGFYVFNAQTSAFDPFDDLANSTWSAEPPFESGAGGLVSTVDDYLAFCQMLLNKGRYGRERILSRVSVELMTSDQVSPVQRAGSDIFFGGYGSWAFGMAVDIKRDQIYHTPGRFGWDGGFGTSAYTDPVEGVIGILLTQRMIDSPEPPKLYDDFWTLAYQALDD